MFDRRCASAARFREAGQSEREDAGYHLAWCEDCRAGLENLRSFHEEMLAWAPEARPAPAPEAALRAKPAFAAPAKALDDALESGLRWLSGLRAQALASLEILRAPRPVYGFAETETAMPRQEIRFAESGEAESDLRGSYRMEQGQRWIHLEHGQWPAGSLLFLEIADAEGVSLWRRFVTLRKGFKRSVAEARIEAENVGEYKLRVTQVAAADLPAEAAQELENSFALAAQENPALREVWRAWAAQAIQETPHAALRQALDRITVS